MRKKFKIQIILIFALIVLFFNLFVFYYNSNKLVQINTLNISLEVSNTTGIALSNSSLEFGKIVPGSSMKKNLNLTNSYSFPIKVVIDSKGNVSKFLQYPKVFYLNETETKSFEVIAKVLPEQKTGIYKGKLKVLIYN